MKGLNKVILLGTIAREPDFKSIEFKENNRNMCVLLIVTNDYYTGSDGKKQEDTQWHRVIAWGKMADMIVDKCRKGDVICIEGKLRTRKFTKNNVEESITEVVVCEFSKVSSKKNVESSQN